MDALLAQINGALADAVGRQTEVGPDTHLIEDGVLDSLDSAIFLLNVEKATGVKLPEDEVDARDLYRIANLVAFIQGARGA